ncbi:MAG: hypothetical protein WCT01_02165 [Candidatus Shapirobacteria bacterium]
MEKEIKSKIRHRIQNQLGITMLEAGMENPNRDRLVKKLKIISILTEILGQLEKDQNEIEVPLNLIDTTAPQGGLMVKRRPLEVEVSKLKAALGPEVNPWPEIAMLEDYLTHLTASITKAAE